MPDGRFGGSRADRGGGMSQGGPVDDRALLTREAELAESLSTRHVIAIRLIKSYMIAIMLFPSDAVFPPLGASGYVASIVALVTFAAYMVWMLRGTGGAEITKHPLWSVVILFWLVSLSSYLKFNLDAHDGTTSLAADRWLLLLAGLTGVIMITGNHLRDRDDVMSVLRTLSWAGAVCGLVAALQFWASVDLSPLLRQLPGLKINAEEFGIQLRGSLNRVSGTAIHPIELGTTTAMVLPFAIHVLIFDKKKQMWRRLLPTLLIAAGIPAAVSRSAILAAAVSLGVFLVCQPPMRRIQGFLLAPVVVSAIFVSTPGLIGTLLAFFRAGTSDPSIYTRTGDYPFVLAQLQKHPVLGRGGGTVIPQDVFEILDNQYLSTVLDLGLAGLIALLCYVLFPALLALRSFARSNDEVSASLSAACLGATLGAAVSMFTFDAFSFPMFTGVHALVLGITAATSTMTRRGPAPV